MKKKPAKKKTSKKKLVPPRGNKSMQDFLVDPPASFKSPDSIGTVTTKATSVDTATYATPPTVPKEVDTTSVMTRYSVVSSSSSAKTASSSKTTSSETDVDMSKPCKGCHNPFFRCMERRWHDICLHAVIDYFEEVDFDSVCEAGVREAYYSTFKVKIKSEIMEQSGGFYEIEDNVVIPECMVQGSLKDAIGMMGQDNETYHYLMTKRVHDVQRHLYRLKRVWPPQLKKGERIVDKDRGIVYHNPFDPNGSSGNNSEV